MDRENFCKEIKNLTPQQIAILYELLKELAK